MGGGKRQDPKSQWKWEHLNCPGKPSAKMVILIAWISFCLCVFMPRRYTVLIIWREEGCFTNYIIIFPWQHQAHISFIQIFTWHVHPYERKKSKFCYQFVSYFTPSLNKSIFQSEHDKGARWILSQLVSISHAFHRCFC